MITKRKVEIIAFQRERIIKQVVMRCPVCLQDTELLSARQAAVLTRVKPKTVYCWLAQGRAHGVRTAGGHRVCRHRVCRNSLFHATSPGLKESYE